MLVKTQGADGSRQPSARELEVAETHGKSFYQAVAKVNFAWLDGSAGTTAAATSKEEPPSSAAAAANGTKATTGGTKASESAANQTEGAPNAAQTEGVQEKSGPCGLPSKCEIL